MHTLTLAFFLALRSIRSGHRPTIVLIVLILALTFANSVFIGGILSGLTQAVYAQVIGNFTSHVVVEPQEEPARKDFVPHAQELRRQIEQIPGVLATATHYRLPATFAYDKEKNGRLKSVSGEVVGVEPHEEKLVTLVWKHMLAGRYLEWPDVGEVILGSDLAGGYGGSQELTSLGGVRVGESITATFSNGVERTYRVKGIYRVRFGFVDRMAFISAREAESVLSAHNSASQVLVRLDTSKLNEDQCIARIQRMAPNLKVRKWVELMGDFLSFSRALDLIAVVVSSIALLVATVTIFILIYVNAMSRRRQIGILKAIGVRQSVIICSYAFQALFYTVSGLLIGAALIFFILIPYFLEHPLKMPMGDVHLALQARQTTYTFASLLVAGVLAGSVPAWRVVKTNIIKAVWGV